MSLTIGGAEAKVAEPAGAKERIRGHDYSRKVYSIYGNLVDPLIGYLIHGLSPGRLFNTSEGRAVPPTTVRMQLRNETAMRRSDNPELQRKMLNYLADLYKIKEVREPNHLSSYVTCRTKAFLDHKQAVDPTDEEVLLFALGYGLQDVLTPKSADAPVVEKHDIIYRPDMILSARLNEVKTTRRSAKNHTEDLPATWIDYMLGGCYMMEESSYDLIVLYLMGNYSPPFPKLLCDTIVFEDVEIEDGWRKIMKNKEAADEALETGKLPTPYENCYEWECRFCRYKLVCETVTKLGG